MTEMTFSFAVSVLESKFDAIYRGTETVREMITDLTDAISWEGESPEKVYHRFESKVGADTLVADDQVLKLAKHYV